MADFSLSPADQQLFNEAQECVRQRNEKALARKQALDKLAQERGLSKPEAQQVYAEMERARKAQLKRQKDAEKHARQKELEAQKQAEHRAQKEHAANVLAFEKDFKAAADQEKRDAQALERKALRSQALMQRAFFRSLGVSNSADVIEDWFSLAVWWGLFGFSAIIIGPLGGLWSAIDSGWDNFTGSWVGRRMGFGEAQSEVDISGAQYFAALKIEAPHLLDDSPLGSWDFTLIDSKTDSTKVSIPAPCFGRITEAGWLDGYGNAVDLECQDGTTLFMAHLDRLDVNSGDRIQKGDLLGVQGSTGNSTGDHIHLEIALPGESAMSSDRAKTRPIVDELFAFWQSGASGHVPAEAIELISRFEGFHPTPYWDYAQWTWGYGTKAPCNTNEECKGKTISREAAKAEQVQYISQHCSPLVDSLELTTNQQAATLSLCYNLGPEQYEASEVHKQLVDGDVLSAANAFELYIHAGKVKLAGLVRRRSDERDVFLGN